jgi:hypothetical protein
VGDDEHGMRTAALVQLVVRSAVVGAEHLPARTTATSRLAMVGVAQAMVAMADAVSKAPRPAKRRVSYRLIGSGAL